VSPERKVSALLLCAALCAAPRAQAQTPPDRAGALLLQGDRLHAGGKHRAALKRYVEARRLGANPLVSYKLGLTLLALNRKVLAAEQLQHFLTRAPAAPLSARRLAARLLARLRRALGSISVSCPVAGVRVLIDGRVVGRTPMKRRFYVSPGRHRIVMQKAGYVDETRDVVLEAGVYRQLDLLMKGGAQGPVARPVEPVPEPIPAPAPRPAEPRPAWEDLVSKADAEQHKRQRRRKTIYAYATLGVGAALLAGAGVLYGVGASRGSEAHDQYLASGNQAQMDYHYQDVEAARTMLAVGHALAGAGAVSVALSIYHFATRPSVMEKQTTVEIVPTVGGVSVGGRF